jgi:hypothetical protein
MNAILGAIAIFLVAVALSIFLGVFIGVPGAWRFHRSRPRRSK